MHDHGPPERHGPALTPGLPTEPTTALISDVLGLAKARVQRFPGTATGTDNARRPHLSQATVEAPKYKLLAPAVQFSEGVWQHNVHVVH